MKNNLKLVTDFLEDESGVALIEYGLIAALIAVVAIPSLKSLGQNLNDQFSVLASAMSGITGSATN